MDMVSVLFQYHTVIIFVVPISYQILSIPYVNQKLKAKFLVPLFLTLVACFCFFFDQGIVVVLQKTLEFTGKSILLHEVYKNFFKRREK